MTVVESLKARRCSFRPSLYRQAALKGDFIGDSESSDTLSITTLAIPFRSLLA
jgi:hypothetical protein